MIKRMRGYRAAPLATSRIEDCSAVGTSTILKPLSLPEKEGGIYKCLSIYLDTLNTILYTVSDLDKSSHYIILHIPTCRVDSQSNQDFPLPEGPATKQCEAGRPSTNLVVFEAKSCRAGSSTERGA